MDMEGDMREITIRLERNGPSFDIWIKSDGEWEIDEKRTPTQVHNLVRSEIDSAMESL